MAAVIRKVATITQKGQITVPKPVRDALGLDYGGRIVFSIDENRNVSLERDAPGDADPVIDAFVEFLESDMRRHPDASIREIPEALRDRIARLTRDGNIDLEAPIEGDVAI